MLISSSIEVSEVDILADACVDLAVVFVVVAVGVAGVVWAVVVPVVSLTTELFLVLSYNMKPPLTIIAIRTSTIIQATVPDWRGAGAGILDDSDVGVGAELGDKSIFYLPYPARSAAVKSY